MLPFPLLHRWQGSNLLISCYFVFAVSIVNAAAINQAIWQAVEWYDMVFSARYLQFPLGTFNNWQLVERSGRARAGQRRRSLVAWGDFGHSRGGHYEALFQYRGGEFQ